MTFLRKKEDITNHKTNRPSEGKKTELSPEELDKVSGGLQHSGSNENPTELDIAMLHSHPAPMRASLWINFHSNFIFDPRRTTLGVVH